MVAYWFEQLDDELNPISFVFGPNCILILCCITKFSEHNERLAPVSMSIELRQNSLSQRFFLKWIFTIGNLDEQWTLYT